MPPGPQFIGNSIANCDPGDVATGGGFEIFGPWPGNLLSIAGTFDGVAVAWIVQVSGNTSTEDVEIQANVVCADVTP
ncbi:hypothetical protein [Streptomyces sp. NPDC005407]|uniref:hypothetical protein n=1 Tax=Streptomyces sp. NPDC005407 TaxID=3155340 RepID=UPI00339F75D6